MHGQRPSASDNGWKRRLSGSGRQPGEGLGATWWAISTLILLLGGVVLLTDRLWWAIVFVIAGVWTAVVTLQRAPARAIPRDDHRPSRLAPQSRVWPPRSDGPDVLLDVDDAEGGGATCSNG